MNLALLAALALTAQVDAVDCNVQTHVCVTRKIDMPNTLTPEQLVERQKGVDAKCAERKSDRSKVQAAKAKSLSADEQAQVVAAMARLTEPEPEWGCRPN